MKAVVWLIGVVSLFHIGMPLGGAQDRLLPDPLWIHLDSDWYSAPPEVGYEESWIRARILRLYDDGQFSLLACILRRTKYEIGISGGDGYILYRGSWSMENGRIKVQYEKVEESIRSSDPPRSRSQTSDIEIEDGQLDFDGIRFEASEILQVEQYDSFVEDL